MALIKKFILKGFTDGEVTGTTITAGGSGYTAATAVFSAPTTPGGTTATGTVTVVAGAVTAITVTDVGAGYTSAPTVTISGDGTGATATAAVSSSSAINSLLVERHSNGSWRFTYKSVVYVYDGDDARVNALLKLILSGSTGIPTTEYLLGNPGV